MKFSRSFEVPSPRANNHLGPQDLYRRPESYSVTGSGKGA